MMATKKLVLLSILLAISIVLNIVERFMLGGLTGLPMIRLGLANIVVLMIFYLFNAKDAFVINAKDAFVILVLRIFIVGVYTSLFSPTFFLALGGGIVAYMGMLIGKKIPLFSEIGVSVLGAFGHALGQILMAIFILETEALIVYFPWLVALSLPSGVITGFIAKSMIKRMNQAFIKPL